MRNLHIPRQKYANGHSWLCTKMDKIKIHNYCGHELTTTVNCEESKEKKKADVA